MNLDNYTGNKGSRKAFIEIINNIPPHKYFIELFAGSGSIAKNICTAAKNIILNDIDSDVCDELRKVFPANIAITNYDGSKFLKKEMFNIKCLQNADKKVFIYLDPPYPINSRRSSKKIYKHEMSDEKHIELLNILKLVKCNCMISTYKNEIYSELLSDWNVKSYKVNVHGNIATELLYYNYDDPVELQDYRYIGKNANKRQQINRKVKRNIDRIKAMKPLIRKKILLEIKREFFDE